MSDVEVLDMLFDSSSGILGSVNSQVQTSEKLDSHTGSMELPLFADSDGFHNQGEFDWSTSMLNSTLSLDDFGNNEFFNALMETNVPDEVKEQKQLQPQQKQFSDHAYSITPASPNSDSGVSTGPYSPSSSNGIEDIPFDIDRDLFGPLDLKSYEDSVDHMTAAVDPILLDSISNCSSSPGLIGNESPINFDFDDLSEHNSSVKGLTISTDETTKVIKVLSVNGSHSLLSSNSKVSSNSSSPYPELMLSDEEKNLLRKEGISLPSHLPLTREEEKILRSVRRRIRNKASARNSRRKKQDYMEALEKRVKLCTDEKRQLERKVNDLEKRNSSLIGQLKRLQKLVTDGTRQTAKTGTCAMILALSFALVLLPNYQSLMGGDNSSSHDTLMKVPSTDSNSGRPSRSLLSKPEDYISSTQQQEKSFNYIPFLDFNKMGSLVSPAQQRAAKSAEHNNDYAHDPVDDVSDSIKEHVMALPLANEKVLHMEITKLPEEASIAEANTVHNNTKAKDSILAEDTVRRRAIRMDLDDEL